MTGGRTKLARLMVLLLIGFTTASCHHPAASPHEIGMSVHFRGADAAAVKRQFDLLAAVHAKWVRVDIGWAWVESERGRFDWTYTDAIVNEARARRMHVLAVLAFTPAWARASAPGHAGSTPSHRPAKLSDFGTFARTAAQRYASAGVRSWEIWNEPNVRRFWPPRPDADDYGELFRTAAAAIRDVDPQATMLIGGLSPKFETSTGQISPATYLDQLYANGTAQLADAIAVHPYSFPAMPMQASERMDGEFNDLPALHAVMDHHGDGAKKIWITEYGAPTGTGEYAVSEDDQAAALTQAREQVERWSWAGPLIFYELVDGGTDPGDIEQNFGVFRADLTPKPAAKALMDAAVTSR